MMLNTTSHVVSAVLFHCRRSSAYGDKSDPWPAVRDGSSSVDKHLWFWSRLLTGKCRTLAPFCSSFFLFYSRSPFTLSDVCFSPQSHLLSIFSEILTLIEEQAVMERQGLKLRSELLLYFLPLPSECCIRPKHSWNMSSTLHVRTFTPLIRHSQHAGAQAHTCQPKERLKRLNLNGNVPLKYKKWLQNYFKSNYYVNKTGFPLKLLLSLMSTIWEH